jgi:5-formyltetrahydrofolate cyclo-ligase
MQVCFLCATVKNNVFTHEHAAITVIKTDLRKKLRELCRHISLAYRQEAALAAAKYIVNLPLFKQSERIACTLSTKNEFETSPLIEAIWQAKKRCYVPIVQEKKESPLHFARYQYGDALHHNRYSILEPVNSKEQLAPEAFDLVMVPLLGFDRQGHRLGMGGGYYDRTFAFLHNQPSKKPQMIGLAYAAQEITALPFDAWDILLDGVLTEKEFIVC